MHDIVGTQGEFLPLATKKFLAKIIQVQHGVWCPLATFVLCLFLFLSQQGSQHEIPLPKEITLFATPWTVALQTPLSMRFSRQEYWSGLPCPPPGDFPDPGIKLLHWQAGSLPLVSPGKARELYP